MLTKDTIEDRLKYLHSRLPKHPTSVNASYLLPKHLRKEVLASNFSEASLQKVADHVGYFLGLLNSVKVKIGIESSEYMLSTARSAKNPDHVGLYKVIAGPIREIQLTKKFRFELCHILAILAHESTHDYLCHHRIEESSESENEVLTDLAAAYLGLGGLLLKGYEPISWTSDEWDILIASGHTNHTMEIGYVTPANIRYAIYLAAKLRNLKNLAAPLPTVDRIKIALHFRRLRKSEEKSTRRIELLREKLNRVKSLYSQTQSKMQRASEISTQLKIAPEDGHKLVEIANAFSAGKIQLEIERLSRDVNALTSSVDANGPYFTNMSSEVDNLSMIISDWYQVLSKYIA